MRHKNWYERPSERKCDSDGFSFWGFGPAYCWIYFNTNNNKKNISITTSTTTIIYILMVKVTIINNHISTKACEPVAQFEAAHCQQQQQQQ